MCVTGFCCFLDFTDEKKNPFLFCTKHLKMFGSGQAAATSSWHCTKWCHSLHPCRPFSNIVIITIGNRTRPRALLQNPHPRELIRKTSHKQQQRPESLTVTLTWHARDINPTRCTSFSGAKIYIYIYIYIYILQWRMYIWWSPCTLH